MAIELFLLSKKNVKNKSRINFRQNLSSLIEDRNSKPLSQKKGCHKMICPEKTDKENNSYSDRGTSQLLLR